MLDNKFTSYPPNTNLQAIRHLMAVGTVKHMLLRTWLHLVLIESFTSQVTGKHFTLMLLPGEDIKIH